MEKIYMEDKENDKKYRHAISGSFGSKTVFVSLAVAIIVVMVAVVWGFSGSSYAIPDISYSLPDTFKTQDVSKQYESDTGFSVFPYYTDGGIQVFCLEHMIDFVGLTDFTKGDAITDYGLLYLMANIYPNKNFDTFLHDGLQTWISQTAIWVYLYRVEDLANDGVVNNNVEEYIDGEKNPHYISPEDLVRIQTARGVVDVDDTDLTYYTRNSATGGVSVGGVTAQDPLLYEVIDDLVNRALNNRNVPNKNLSINFDNEVAVTQDNKYYQTSLVSVVGSPSDNFNGFELKLDSAPDGTFVVDANGQKIDDWTNLTATDKFYFRVPIDKVTESNKAIKFTVTGSFKTYEGNYYVAPGAQTITSVGTVNNNINKGAEIPLNYTPSVPDTGMSTAQTVYFIGLIILLSGVGIIYANVKPEESK